MPPDLYPSFAHWMREQGYADRSVDQYQRIVRRYVQSGLSAQDWLLDQRERSRTGSRNLPTASSKTYEKAIRAFLRFRGEDPEQVSLPRIVRYARPRPQRALRRREERVLRDRLELVGVEGAVTEPVRTVLLLMLDTGLRVSEAVGLRLDDLEVDDGLVIAHVQGKGDRERVVALSGQTALMLARYIERTRGEGRLSPWLFPSEHHGGAKPICTSSVRKRLGRLAAELDLGRVTPHTLRHTVATRMAEGGVDQRIAAAALGHRSERTTAVYQHPGPEAVKAALGAVRD